MPTPIQTDRVMRSNMRRMCKELPEAAMEAAQIVTETVIEHDLEFSNLFSLPPLASLSTQGAVLMLTRQDEMLPSDIDEMSNVLYPMGGRVGEGQT